MEAKYVLVREREQALIMPVYLEEQLVVLLRKKRQELAEALIYKANEYGIEMKHMLGRNTDFNTCLESIEEFPDLIPELVGFFNFDQDVQSCEGELFRSLDLEI